MAVLEEVRKAELQEGGKNMTLYDIDAEILKVEQKAAEIFDEETGEVTNIDEFEQLKAQFDALQMDRKQKISNIACLYKQVLAEAEAIKTEKMALAKRQQSAENRAESLKRYLDYALQGEKFEDARCKISYRTSEAVTFADGFDYSKLPTEFQKVTVEPNKVELKKAIKDGQGFAGVFLQKKTSTIIK